MVMMSTVTMMTEASGTMGTIVPMLQTMKRRKWSTGIRIDFGVGAGEGLAAVCGHQSGAQGMRVVKPVSSMGDRNGVRRNVPLPGTNSFFFSVVASAAVESARESACVNDCDPGAAATGKMPVVPVRPYVGRRWNAAPTGRDGARPSRWERGCKKRWGRALFYV